MSLYGNLATTALKQIADKGRLVTLKATTETEYDPSAPYVPSESQLVVKALITNFSSREIDNEIILRDDVRMIIPAKGLEKPSMNTVVLDGDQSYRTINVQELKPGDTAILYYLQVRK